MAGYTIQYRTFDQLVDDVRVDFQNYTLENMIEPQQLIKVAKRVTYDLGLRVFKTKEDVLEVNNHRVKLPDTFFSLNFGFMCDEFTVETPVISGTHVTERPIKPVTYQCAPPEVIDVCNTPNQTETPIPCDTGCETPFDPCTTKPCVKLNCKGEKFELIEITRTYTRTYKRFHPLHIKDSGRTIDCDCPNTRVNSPNQAWIKDNYLYTNFECGKVYINYQGMLENDEGQLLVVDHDLINEYYEYALKERILENLLFNDEPVDKKLQYVQQKLRAARNQAVSLVNMPNFNELKQLWETNRRAQYHKYVDMFKSYEPLGFNSNGWY